MLAQFSNGATDLMGIFLLMSSVAMLTLILVALVYVFSINAAGTSLAIDTGLAVTSFVARKLWIASMLQMVALYNIAGGAATSAIAAAEIYGDKAEGISGVVVSMIGALLGAISMSGSLIACTKLSGFIKKSLRPWNRKTFSLTFAMAALAVCGYIVFTAQGRPDGPIAMPDLIYWLLGSGLLLGALITLPIRSVQMPAAIYFYNVLTCVVISLEGFALRDPTLICASMLVGGVRLVLTLIMVRPSVVEAERADNGVRACL